MNFNFDVTVIGGGPAGMAAALAASKEGAKVCILERSTGLGGILVQCIHNGFGLHYFKEELTGPEYAERFAEKVKADGNVTVMLEAMVISVTADKKVTAISPEHGIFTVEAASLVLAMGCRERAAGAIALPGTRPAGIYSAGCAQRLVNIEGQRVGNRVVIVGSGDIGLIMARRMTFEGAKVECVVEIMPYSSGLKRNIVQCLDDYGIPLHFATTITRVIGKNRVEGVYIAPLGKDNAPDLSQEKFVPCDTVLLSVGLIPENDLVSDIGLSFDRVTSGAAVNEMRETNIDGIFAAGNTLHVHDLVDNVSAEGEIAGRFAALKALGKSPEKGTPKSVKGVSGVRYTLPQTIVGNDGKVKIYFRVDNIYRLPKLFVKCGEQVILQRKYPVLTPGEMEAVEVNIAEITGDVTLSLEV